MDDKKKRILGALTKEWQSTKGVAKKLKTGGQNIIEGLYELFVDDKKANRKLMPWGEKGHVAYWKLK